MSKSNLGKTFVRSLVRQVGRDAGKVVSNKAFGDAHSTPIRMVQSADTSPQYSGKRKTYRHDLDRVVNGDLPSSVSSAKKCIVKLENALKDFLNDLMPIGSANDIALMKSWMDKSADFVEDVLKIVDKPDVKALAENFLQSIDDIKRQTKGKVMEMEAPVDDSIPKKRRNARIVFWLGMALMILPGAFVGDVQEASTTQSEMPASNDEIAETTTVEALEVANQNQGEVNSPAGVLVVSGCWIIIVGVVMLRRSKKRRKAFESLTENTNGLKLAVATW